MNKTAVIENLYSVFKKYTTSDMHYCDCGCIDPKDVKKLASKKLRALEEDDFCAYHGSALYTWGELEHYKHFLPRILEVHNELNGRGLIGLFEITSKLDHAKWDTWEVEEVEAIQDFIRADWNDFVNISVSEIGKDDLEYYSFFLEPKALIKRWEIIGNENGMRNFVNLFYDYGSEFLYGDLKKKGKDFNSAFKVLIKQGGLVESLEDAFFKMEHIDGAYADRISFVTQMIEKCE